MRRLSVAVIGLTWFMSLNTPGWGDTRTVSVAGEGSVSAPPDIATAQTGVVSVAPSAREALDQNNAAMKKLLSLLKQQGIADKDVQTTQFRVNPEYRPRRGRQEEPEIIGYRVTNQVHARVRELSKLGEIIDAMIQSGSNQISGVQFGIDNPQPLADRARKQAMQDAERRASLYAEAADLRLGKVQAINEVSHPTPRPFAGRVMAMEAADSVPIATGEQSVRVRIEVVYELD